MSAIDTSHQRATVTGRESEFEVVAGRRYRLGIDASDVAGRESPRGLAGILEFLDSDGNPIEGAPEGAVRTDRHGDVVYLPTHASGEAGPQLSDNLLVTPAGAVRLRVRVRNWKCSPDVVLHSMVQLVEEREPTLCCWELAVQASKPYVLALTLRGAVRHARAAILAIEFLDGTGEVIPGPYEACISSKRFGAFRYLRATTDGAPLQVPLLAPSTAERVRVFIHPWQLALDQLEVPGQPELKLTIPEGLEASECSLLSSTEWGPPHPLGECRDGLVHLALECVCVERQPGAAPVILVDFLDEHGGSLGMPDDVCNSRPSITVESPTVLARRGGFFHCPLGAVAARFRLAPSDSYCLLVRPGVEIEYVPARHLPQRGLSPLGSGQSLTLRQAVSSLWSVRLEFDGFAMGADNRALEIGLSLLDASGQAVSPKGALLESTHASAVIKHDVLTVTPHSMASGTQGVVRFASSLRILPPRGAVTVSIQVMNPRTQGVAIATSLLAYDRIVTDRLVPESIPEIVAIDERYPTKVIELGEAYLQRHDKEPRVLTHLLDVYRRFGDLGRLEKIAHRALAEKGPNLAKLHTKARHALSLLRELDPTWLPTSGLGVQIPNPPARGPELRVAHLFKTTVPVENTGGAIRCLNIVKFQRKIGMQPMVVTPLGYPDAGGTGEPWERETIDGIHYFRLNGIGRQALRAVTSTTQLEFTAMLTARLLAEQGVDVVQASSGYRGYEQALVGLAVSRAIGVPFVYEVRSYHEHTWRSMTDWLLEADHTKRRVEQENRCMREADAVVTICETMKQGLVERGIAEDKIFVVPNSVDLEKFHEVEPAPELRARLNLADDLVVGYISNVSEREGHHVLLRAVAQARAAGFRMKCLVVGAGPELARVRTLANELGIAEHVAFTGEVAHDQVPAYYALIDIFVVPRVEDFASDHVTPMKPFEAMAMRRPLVVSDRPALLEIVGGQRGLVFRAGDHVDLAERLAELADAPDKRVELAQEGRRWIETERSWDRTVRIYDQVYAHARQAAGDQRPAGQAVRS